MGLPCGWSPSCLLEPGALPPLYIAVFPLDAGVPPPPSVCASPSSPAPPPPPRSSASRRIPRIL